MMRLPLRAAAAAAVGLTALTCSQVVTPPAHAATVASERANVPPPTGIVAKGAELINAGNGHLLWGRAANIERPMASITKIMTAIVVIKAGHLDRKIRVTAAAESYAQSHGAGTAGLHPGDLLTTRQLLEAMLVPSGADAAYLLAHTYGPGWRAFVHKMNVMASKLGMARTHFANFDGLPWPTQHSTYSTPRNLIRMGRFAMRMPTISQIVGQRTHFIAATSQHHSYYWTSTDLLLTRYRGAIGIKTGFTSGAGYCLLFEARRNGHELMGVVLDSTTTNPATRFTAAARLLNWGFRVALAPAAAASASAAAAS